MHWPMTLSLRVAPGPTTRASGLRQRSAGAALKRNLKKAKRGWGPLAGAPPGAAGSASEELTLTAREDPGRSGGSWQTWPEGSRRWLQRVLASCAGDAQRLLAGADLVELAGLAELAE